jgi:hypothetical protein
MRAVDGDFAKLRLASVLPSMEWAASGAADSTVSYCRWGKHMFKRSETSAEHLDERLDPSRANRGNRTMRQVGIRGSLRAAATTVVHDVQGPIVTGVLGGD